MMLLDEPTAGMAHEDVERIAALIKRRRGQPHRADGRAQPVGGVDAVRPHHRARARRDAGRRATTRTVSKNPDVVEAYLGAGHA